MSERKQKPGPKRAVGRPSVARRRERDRERLTNERDHLKMGGFQKITIVVPASDADWLLEESPVNRLEGLVRAAELSGDQPLAIELKARLLAAKGRRDAARVLRMSEKRNKAIEQVRPSVVAKDVAAAKERSAAVDDLLSPFFGAGQRR